MLRRKLTIPHKAHPWVRRLYKAMNQEDISPREVERRAGLSHLLLNSWRQNRQKPDIDTIVAALEVVGIRVCLREIDYAEDGSEIVPAKAQMSSQPKAATGFEIVG